MVKRAGNVDIRRIEVEEAVVTDAQYLLQGVMNEKGLSRADVARLAGLSKARVTQLLRDDANPTLRNLAMLFDALGEEICIARKKSARKTKVQEHEFLWTDFAFPSESKQNEISFISEGDLERVLSASIHSADRSKNPATPPHPKIHTPYLSPAEGVGHRVNLRSHPNAFR